MDFFQAQDAAKTRSQTLVLLFIAAVVAIIIAVYLVVHIGVQAGPFNPPLFLAVAAGTTALIAIGSTVRTIQLRKGGSRVAELLGGRRVLPNTTDEAERRFINVVEEMAIASGTPVPAMYVLDQESGINAFAAGYALDDAAVAVTRGTIQSLTRDELQGVIAHEFSHILNADMKLNIRLMGLLYGILLLAVIGRGILRGGMHVGGGRRRKGGGGQVALLGLGLIVVGYIGVFFGRLIQAAVSRQREYLADAAAVQFTRNPHGIAGALKKIGGGAGSRIENHHAQEASHFFFANGLRMNMMSMFATHPPLGDRIKRIDPSFDAAAVTDSAAASGVAFSLGNALREVQSVPGTTLLASIGTPDAGHVAYAHQLLDSLPPSVTAAAHDPARAAALLFALLLDERAIEAQNAALHAHGGDALVARAHVLAHELAALGRAAQLPLLHLLIPALSGNERAELQRVRATAAALIEADDRTDVFESTLLNVLDRQLSAGEKGHNAAAAGATRLHSFESARAECEVVLSAIAWAGAETAADAGAAFTAGAANLPRLEGAALRARDTLSTRALGAALEKLRPASPALRRTLIEACTHAVAHDGRVYALEAELLRAVADGVDIPMPPVATGASAPTAGGSPGR